jgi:hypothetical protein
MTVRSNLGIYNNVALTVRYRCKHPHNLEARLFNALATVIPKHPILSALPVCTETTSPYFVRLPFIDLNQVVNFFNARESVNINEHGRSPGLDRFLMEQHNQPFKHTNPLSPFWRLYVLYQASDPSHFILSFIFHHCLGDTKSALIFHTELEAALATSSGDEPANTVLSSDIPLAPPLDDYLDRVSPGAGASPQEPAAETWSGASQFFPARTRFSSHVLSVPTSKNLVAVSKGKQVSLTSTLQTILAAALFRLLPQEYAMIQVDCAISLRPWLAPSVLADSIGCLVDNFSTRYHWGPFDWDEVRRTKDVIDAVMKKRGGDNLCGKIRQIPDLKSWFEGQMGQQRPSAMELSNIGKFGPSLEFDDFGIEGILFSQSAGACSGAIKVSIATGRDERLSLGFSWQGGVVENDFVDRLIGELDNLLIEVCDVAEPYDA